MNKLYLLASFVFTLATSSYVYMLWHNKTDEQPQTITQEIMPDFVAEQLSSNIYNSDGRLSHNIKAERMEHFNQLATTNFEFPYYTLYPKNASAAWHLSANNGSLNHHNRLRLENRVLLKATDKNSLIQEIHGKYFELDLNTNIISSNQTIMIVGNDFTMYGSGLIIDLNTTQMTLTEHVQTIYKKHAS